MCGGIIGTSTNENINIWDCKNNGNVYANALYTGGIVGQVYKKCTIKNCNNSGDIYNSYTYVGGIAGVALDTNIENCQNSGKIEGKLAYVGGIVAQISISEYTISEIKNCNNTGDVKANGMISEEDGTVKVSLAGGIVGVLGKLCTMENCSNSGKIYGEGRFVAGIAGETSASTRVSNCSNNGIVSNEEFAAGGIVGRAMEGRSGEITTIEKCYNSAKIKGNGFVGGIIGSIDQNEGSITMQNCYNKGAIEGTEYIGGIIGNIENPTGNTIKDLYYLQSVGVGAINGADDTTNKVEATTRDFTSLKAFLTWRGL